MTGPSSTPRCEHTPRPGIWFTTTVGWSDEQLADDAAPPPPRPNRATPTSSTTEEAMTDLFEPRDKEIARLRARVAKLKQRLTDQASSDEVARRAAQAIAGMGVDIRAIRSERDRYRAAWKSARHRAVPDPGTVTITQARHDHLVAGQCIHHQDTHRLHHTEPVTGCPYKGCHPDA